MGGRGYRELYTRVGGSIIVGRREGVQEGGREYKKEGP